MDFRDLYKILRAPTVAESLGKRTQNVIAERHEKQREHFWRKRVQSQTSPPMEQIPAEKKKNPRAEMLKKWKEEKLKKMEEEKKNKKPIFKVGVVHRKANGSPLLANAKALKKKPVPVALLKKSPIKTETNSGRTDRQGVITRSKARNMKVLNVDKKPKFVEIKATVKSQEKPKHQFCKIESGKKKPFHTHGFNVPKSVSELPYSNKLTYPYSPVMSSRLSKAQIAKEIKFMENKNEKDRNKEKESLIQVEVAKEKLPKEIEKETEAKKNELKPLPHQGNTTPKKSPTPTVAEMESYVPIHYSPFVTVRKSRRSGKKAKRSLNLDVDTQIEKEEKEFRCRIFSFRRYIECETKRLRDESNKWKCVLQEFQELPSDVEGEINSVIGKTNLLTSDKFKQFQDLIVKCEGGDPLIKIDDLQGFQDWVSIEVERIDEDFNKLDKTKCNNWVPEAVENGKVKTKKPTANKNPTKRPIGKSNIRSHILAARKMLKEANPSGSSGCKLPILANEDAIVKVGTPIRKQSLLKDVLNPEAKRKIETSNKKSPVVRERRNSGLEIMVATQKNKLSTPLGTLNTSILPTNYEVFFNENQTPSRGILKKTPRTVNSSKGNVTFHDHLENGRRGLDEKYLKPLLSDESSPIRIVLGDVKNTTPRISTRSQTRLAASMETVI